MKRSAYTVEQYARLWVLAAPSADTMRRRETGVRPLVEDFGGRPVDGGVTDPEARSWAPRHPGNIRYAKGLFLAAVEDGVAEKDPFRRCRQPNAKRKVIVPEEADVLAAAQAALELPVYGPEMRAMILAAGWTGMRVTELCELEAAQIVRVPEFEIDVLARLKRGRDRTVAVFEPDSGACVRAALVEQAPDIGRVWRRHPRYGRLREADTIERRDVWLVWNAVRAMVGLDWCRFHDLRHFHATWLLDRGCTAEEVAWQLFGHPNPKLVIETYGHPSARRARDRMRQRLAAHG